MSGERTDTGRIAELERENRQLKEVVELAAETFADAAEVMHLYKRPVLEQAFREAARGTLAWKSR